MPSRRRPRSLLALLAAIAVASACATPAAIADKGGNGKGNGGGKSSGGNDGGNGKSGSAPGQQTDSGGSGGGGSGGDTTGSGGDQGSGSGPAPSPPSGGGGDNSSGNPPSTDSPTTTTDREAPSAPRRTSEPTSSAPAATAPRTSATSTPARTAAPARSGSAPRTAPRGPSAKRARRPAPRSGSGARRARRAFRPARPLVPRRAGTRIASRGSTPVAKGDPKAPGPAFVPRPVRRVIEVVPQTVKLALGALGALLALAGLGAAVNAVRARRLQFQRHQLVEEVGLLQGALLPEIPTRIGSTWASAAYRPADGPAAGGNFYDAFELAQGGVGVMVGEVCGQGKDRLSESLLVRHALRTHVGAGLAPAEVVARARTELDRDLSGDLGGLVVAAYDPERGSLSYASIGELEPLVVVDGETVLTEPAPEASPELPEQVRTADVSFPVGARACLFSTGLIEARVNGHVMGREGVTRIVGELADDLTAETLVEEVAANSRSLPGDLAACVIEADDDPALMKTGDGDLVAHGQPAGS